MHLHALRWSKYTTPNFAYVTNVFPFQDCLKKLQKCSSKSQGQSEMYSLAISRFDIPGEAGFPLNGVYGRPRTPEEADILRQYFLQLRHETGNRLCDRVSWSVFDARKIICQRTNVTLVLRSISKLVLLFD